jgi:hypothetical protein
MHPTREHYTSFDLVDEIKMKLNTENRNGIFLRLDFEGLKVVLRMLFHLLTKIKWDLDRTRMHKIKLYFREIVT